MRLIDADAFDERVRAAGGMSEEELTEDFKDGVQAVLYMLSNQPTIEPEKRTEERTETHACDLISRQAAIDELDKGAWGAEWDKALAQAMLESLPSAQPEIVRCKDCKYASPNGKYGCKAYHFKLYETHEMKADDYCSFAERRTDEND